MSTFSNLNNTYMYGFSHYKHGNNIRGQLESCRDFSEQCGGDDRIVLYNTFNGVITLVDGYFQDICIGTDDG